MLTTERQIKYLIRFAWLLTDKEKEQYKNWLEIEWLNFDKKLTYEYCIAYRLAKAVSENIWMTLDEARKSILRILKIKL